MGNLATNLQDTARQYPLYPAFRSDGELLSYADLDEFSGRVAGGLRAHGVRPGERVALALVPGTALPVLLYGVLRLGAVAVVLPEEQQNARLRECGAGMIFTTGRGEGNGEEAVRINVGPDFLDQLAFWPQHAEVVYRADDDPAVLHYDDKAGTPDAVVQDHGTLRARAYSDATTGAGIDPGDVVRGCCPPEDTVGGLCGLHATVLAGACLVVPGPTARPCPCSARVGRPSAAGRGPPRRACRSSKGAPPVWPVSWKGPEADGFPERTPHSGVRCPTAEGECREHC